MDPFCKHCDVQIQRDPINGHWFNKRTASKYCVGPNHGQTHEPGDGSDG